MNSGFSISRFQKQVIRRQAMSNVSFLRVMPLFMFQLAGNRDDRRN